MGDIVKLKGEAAVDDVTEATAMIIAWLRGLANELENGEARPVHKAVFTVFEDCGDSVRVHSAFCNARFIERVGIMYAALNDVTNAD